MKLIHRYILIIILCTSANIFISCKQDSPVQSGGTLDNYYWTLVDTTIYPNDMYVADANNLFVTGENTFRITNGVKTEFPDPNFRGTSVAGYDKNYVVFTGNSSGLNSKFKIYNSGTITDFTPTNLYFDYGNILIIEPGKFLYKLGPFSFALYQNGSTTEYILPYTSVLKSFSKIGNSIYIFSKVNSDSLSVHKFENNQPLFLKNVYSPGSLINFTSEPVLLSIGFEQDSIFTGKLSYYNETEWIPFLSIRDGIFYNAFGESHNFGIVLIDRGINGMSIESWKNGIVFKESSPLVNNIPPIPRISNLKDNTVYIYYYLDKHYLIKGQRILY